MQRLVYRSAFRRPPVKKPTCERASALEVDKTLFLKLTGRIPQYPTQTSLPPPAAGRTNSLRLGGDYGSLEQTARSYPVRFRAEPPISWPRSGGRAVRTDLGGPFGPLKMIKSKPTSRLVAVQCGGVT